jgi:hypothetical protein
MEEAVGLEWLADVLHRAANQRVRTSTCNAARRLPEESSLILSNTSDVEIRTGNAEWISVMCPQSGIAF